MSLCLDSIRDCLDSGGIPSTIATCAADGTPNVTYISHVEYVDAGHVALTFQFFNKTRENILAQPRARAYVTDSASGASYRLLLHYLRTEHEGPLFERMKARLAGIASHTGMAGVFRLRGADVYRVLQVEPVAGIVPQPQPARPNLLGALRRGSARIAAAGCYEELLDAAVASLREDFRAEHAMLLVHDAARGRLYTVASHGYAESGVGSEIGLGEGVVGTAAAQRVPIRIPYMTSEYAYSRTALQSARQGGYEAPPQTEIPLPGLAEAHSQLAVPILAGERLLGVLYLESPQPKRFGWDDEDALMVLAAQLAAASLRLQEAEEEHAPAEPAPAASPAAGAAVPVRRYTENDSVFVGDSYLIKGVAGAIVWKLLSEFCRDGRTEFSNRELRLDPAIRLPEIGDNLEARLALLNRRLAERCDFLRLHRTGRGRFRLEVQRPLKLVEIPRHAAA